MMKHCNMAFLCCLALVATGCKEQQTREVQPVGVKVMRVEPTQSGSGRRFSGTVEEAEGTTLSFPVAGTVKLVRVEAGQNVMPGMPVVRLVKVSEVKVCFSVPENEISHVGMGQRVVIGVSALDDRQFSGRIVEKGIAASPLSRSYEVKALVSNPSGELLPGMICTLNIGLEKDSSTIMLPARIIQTDEGNRCFVWTNQKGMARKKVVKTGAFGQDGGQITAGLDLGDEVIVEGQQKVSEGMRVTIYN